MSQPGSTAKKNVSKTILERLKVLGNLPHFPDALMKLEQLLASNQDVHLGDISSLVAQDPRLTAGVIGVVNSARYSPGYEITAIGEAVGRLGTSDVRMMAHAINYKSAIKTKPPFSEKEFMRHAMLSAFVAQLLARELHLNAGEAFLCGLMHDIGVYLLATEDRDAYKQVITGADNDASRLVAEEQSRFGTTHAMMGARLLQQWRFPVAIIMGVAHHHSPDQADEQYKNYAMLTCLAEYASYVLRMGNAVVSPRFEEMPENVCNCLTHFGIGEEHYKEVVQDALDLATNSGMV